MTLSFLTRCARLGSIPTGTGLQERVPNHLRRLWSKAMVVSAEGKSLAMTRSGIRQEEDCKGTTVEVSKAIRRCQNRGWMTAAGQSSDETWSFGPSVNTKSYAHTSRKLGIGSRASRVVVQSCLLTGSWHVAWLHDGSRMTRECPVRFCERLGVKLPGATLPPAIGRQGSSTVSASGRNSWWNFVRRQADTERPGEKIPAAALCSSPTRVCQAGSAIGSSPQA